MKQLTTLLLLGFGLYLIASFSHSLYELWNKQEAVTREQQKVESARAANDKLKNELRYVQSDQFVEEQAREKLGMVKPGETVVIIQDKALLEATKSANPTPTPLPNPLQWLSLFTH
jgi:cell division protein FtsB